MFGVLIPAGFITRSEPRDFGRVYNKNEMTIDGYFPFPYYKKLYITIFIYRSRTNTAVLYLPGTRVCVCFPPTITSRKIYIFALQITLKN